MRGGLGGCEGERLAEVGEDEECEESIGGVVKVSGGMGASEAWGR
jgi:hypothetical protein